MQKVETMEREFFMLGTIEYSAEWLKDLRAHLVKARLFLTEETTKKHLEKALAMLDPVCRTAEEQYKREKPRLDCEYAFIDFLLKNQKTKKKK